MTASLASAASEVTRPALAARPPRDFAAALAVPPYDMNPASLVKISRVASGAPSDSTVTPRGETFRKNLAHRRMRRRVSPARVVLLGGALEYQRAEDGPRLSSMDALLDQEHEHLRTAVARVCALRPDVALVEGTVARFARSFSSSAA